MYTKINQEKKYLGKIVKQYMPTEKVPRTGTGVFYRMNDGRIAMVFSRVYGKGADHDTNDIMVCFSSDEGETYSEPELLLTCDDCNAICTGWQVIYRFTGYFHPRPPMDYHNLRFEMVA